MIKRFTIKIKDNRISESGFHPFRSNYIYYSIACSITNHSRSGAVDQGWKFEFDISGKKKNISKQQSQFVGFSDGVALLPGESRKIKVKVTPSPGASQGFYTLNVIQIACLNRKGVLTLPPDSLQGWPTTPVQFSLGKSDNFPAEVDETRHALKLPESFVDRLSLKLFHPQHHPDLGIQYLARNPDFALPWRGSTQFTILSNVVKTPGLLEQLEFISEKSPKTLPKDELRFLQELHKRESQRRVA